MKRGERRKKGPISHISHSHATAVEAINSHFVVPSGGAANHIKDVAAEINNHE